ALHMGKARPIVEDRTLHPFFGLFVRECPAMTHEDDVVEQRARACTFRVNFVFSHFEQSVAALQFALSRFDDIGSFRPIEKRAKWRKIDGRIQAAESEASRPLIPR